FTLGARRVDRLPGNSNKSFRLGGPRTVDVGCDKAETRPQAHHFIADKWCACARWASWSHPTKENAMRCTAMVLVLLAAALSGGRQGWAQPPKVNSADEEALREFHREFVAAYNKGDARAVAAFYAPDADFVGFRGDAYHGRAQIQERTANSWRKA